MSQDLMDKTRRELFDLLIKEGLEPSKMKTLNKTDLVEAYKAGMKLKEPKTEGTVTRQEVHAPAPPSVVDKVTVTQTVKNEAQESRKIVLSPEADRDQELANVTKKEGVTVFVCGSPQKIIFSETECQREIKQPDGSVIKTHIAAKEMDFKNGLFETSDPQLIQLAINHKKFGKLFSYHKAYIPVDASAMIRERSIALSQTLKDALKERQDGIARAKEFSHKQHPEDGDLGIITDDNPDPNRISELED